MNKMLNVTSQRSSINDPKQERETEPNETCVDELEFRLSEGQYMHIEKETEDEWPSIATYGICATYKTCF